MSIYAAYEGSREAATSSPMFLRSQIFPFFVMVEAITARNGDEPGSGEIRSVFESNSSKLGVNES